MLAERTKLKKWNPQATGLGNDDLLRLLGQTVDRLLADGQPSYADVVRAAADVVKKRSANGK